MPVTITAGGSSLTASLIGDIDHHTAKGMRERIDAAIMDSSGIGLVMGRYRLMEELGGKVVIDNAPTTIRKVMRLSGIDKLATIKYGGAQP